MKPTEEQQYNSDLVASGKDVLVEAGAGCGKSSNLRVMAENNPNLQFLVLCFNAANAQESNEHPNKPKNMHYRTVHGVAYRELVNNEMRAKLKPYLNYKDIPDRLLLQADLTSSAKDLKEEKSQLTILRKGIQDCITNYCRSDSTTLLEYAKAAYKYWFSASEVITNDADLGQIEEKSVELSISQQHKLAEITRDYWLRMIDAGSDISITHDVYLKLFHLRGFKISSVYDKDTNQDIYLDVLCLDEAQDSNPVAVAIFNNSSLQKVIVGDEMQQLYAWRGAGNAMQLYPHFAKGKLTTSFRFGSNIADMANIVLEKAGSEMRLSGCGTKTAIKTHAHLCRTNASALEYIFNCASENPNALIYTSADLKELFSRLYHVNAVSFGQTPKFPNRALKDIMTEDDLDEALEISPELKQLVRLSKKISSFGGGLHAGIQKLQRSITDDNTCQYSVSTIHKSKGLEWDEVTIDNDFLKFQFPEDATEEEREKIIAKTVEEMWDSSVLTCMLYVAITRGQVHTNVPWYLAEIFGQEARKPAFAKVNEYEEEPAF